MDKIKLRKEWNAMRVLDRPDWTTFLSNERKKQQVSAAPEDKMQKAKLAFKHGMNTVDTTMERCILWQRAAFRK